jgi:aldehyde dehydrogenase (NAD+)
VVAAAAAKHLTPTVLELGGQGPCFVTKSCDVELAARRISNTKFMNAGQICTNINHAFAEPEITDQLLERMIYWNDQYLKQGDSHMSRIISEHNFDRVIRLLNNTKGEIVYGGKSNRESKFIHPTIVKGINLDDSLMSEEIFGPLLPMITATVDEAIKITKSLPKPLAMYVFSKDDAVTKKILDQVDSGGVTVNGTLFHSSVDSAPFGGVGDSSYGTFHEEHSIHCFTHKRTVVTPPSFMDKVLNFTYAPYDMKHVGRTNIANTMGFKRGETLEDQRRVGPSRFLRWALPAISVVALAYVASKTNGEHPWLIHLISRRHWSAFGFKNRYADKNPSVCFLSSHEARGLNHRCEHESK